MNIIERTVKEYVYVKPTNSVSEDALVSICTAIKEQIEKFVIDRDTTIIAESGRSDGTIMFAITGEQKGEYIESHVSTDWYTPDTHEYVDGISEEETILTIQQLVEDAFFERDIDISGEIIVDDDSLSWMQTVDRVYNRTTWG